MATIVVRSIGMSIALEGLGPAGLDPSRLLAALEAEHGEAVAPVGSPVEAIVLDRKALPWDDVLSRVEDWIRQSGHWPTTWHVTHCHGSRAARMELNPAGP